MQLEIKNLTKRYKGGVTALEDVSLEISSGMFGLLGPNGAGKSTLMKILATLERQTSGQILIDGEPLEHKRAILRRSLGYLPQTFGVYPQLTGFEFLKYMAQLNSMPAKNLEKNVLKSLESVSLSDARDRKVKTYSGGMLRRLGIAQALIHQPKLVIVDEPTVGLDPEERIRFRNLLSHISRDRIIILSTHIVGDISSTCEDLAILSKGRLVFRGSPAKLLRNASAKAWSVLIPEEDFSKVASQMQIISTLRDENGLQLRVIGDPLPEYEFKKLEPNLEDAYMYFMESKTGERVDEDILIDAVE